MANNQYCYSYTSDTNIRIRLPGSSPTKIPAKLTLALIRLNSPIRVRNSQQFAYFAFMTPELITYLTFGGLLILALIFDLGLLSKKNSNITIRKALWQTVFWVTLALGFFVFVWIEFNRTMALEYLSAYLTEWSLSIDNIFVFILIFSFFAVKED